MNLDEILRNALPGFRWFGGKSKVIRRVTVLDCIPLPEAGPSVQFLLCRVAYVKGEPEVYLLPVDLATASASEPLGTDLTANIRFASALLRRLFSGASVPAGRGRLVSSCLTVAAGRIPAPHRMKGEQSNTSIRFGKSYMLKLMRRLEPGVSPEVEIGQHLSAGNGFAHSPSFLGSLDYVRANGETMTLCTVHRFVPAKGDAWATFLKRLGIWGKTSAVRKVPELPQGWLEASLNPVPGSVRKTLAPFADWADQLGRRTGELHVALARQGRSPAFAPEQMTPTMQAGLVRKLLTQTASTLGLLQCERLRLPKALQSEVDRLLELEPRIRARFVPMRQMPVSALVIRTHGDYHLGQVLYTGSDFLIIDFEGEPARSLEERRGKHSPLRDVAGMLRSFHYAASMGLDEESGDVAKRWTAWISAAFMHGYRKTAGKAVIPGKSRDLELLLDVYLLEKALYELRYEANNRPSWVRVPLVGILNLMEE
jgi:trehalose synthase-fused probable maltokinase